MCRCFPLDEPTPGKQAWRQQVPPQRHISQVPSGATNLTLATSVGGVYILRVKFQFVQLTHLEQVILKKNVQRRGILQLNFLFLLFLLKTVSGRAIIALFNIAIHKTKSSFSIEKINALIKIFNKIKWGRENLSIGLGR